MQPPPPNSPENLTGRLDYLQRIGFQPLPLQSNQPVVTQAPLTHRRLFHIAGIGCLEKRQLPLRQAGEQSLETERQVRIPSEDVLTGLYGYKIPLAFLVLSELGRVTIQMGIWSPLNRENAAAAVLDSRGNLLSTALRSLFPAMKLAPLGPVELPAFSQAGFVLGIPTAKAPEAQDQVLPLDRFIRALSDASWAYLVLAEPLDEQEISKRRDNVIIEMRDILVKYPNSATGTINPLAQHYTDLLKRALSALTQGQTLGAWRTGVYLLGDNASYYRLASLWRGIFSGDHSVLDPVRVWDSQVAAALAKNWAMLEDKGPKGPGNYQHPFKYQTLLTSAQLAAYVHFPVVETNGFTVEIVPDFDAFSPSVPPEDTLLLGNVIPQQQALASHEDSPNRAHYQISTASLTRHAFVAGVTGAGKTNTVFHLLKEVDHRKIPFLVIEPVKTEYRALLQDRDLEARLRIYTLGNERIAPFRLNPFEVVPGTPVSVHLDLLRSVFTASFGMWAPLPQVIEQCLHRIYEDRGWDLTTNKNRRDAGESDPESFPTLSDLIAKVDEVIALLAYDEKISANMRAALQTRLNSLRVGGKGRMLDVQRSLPLSQLLKHPTILELEAMGDDDDRAFLMGLLLIRLVEYRRSQSQAATLQHVLVIEEAHRLLANVGPQRSQEEGDPRGKAVETFANLLSEIRAYGQGVIVADQVPVKLAPDVIKNTNLKIVHRVVAEDDRKVLAGAMAMNERQTRALATFVTGRTAVFSEGDDAPVLVQIPQVKGHAEWRIPNDDSVKEQMQKSGAAQETRSLLFAFPICEATCSMQGDACQTAQALVEEQGFQRTFSRIMLSTIEDGAALDRMWVDLVQVIQAKRPPKSEWGELAKCVCIRASYWYAYKRGAQAGWSFAETRTFAESASRILLEKLVEKDLKPGQNLKPGRDAFQACVRNLHARRYPPFPVCQQVCHQQEPPVCLYRYSVADLVASGQASARWRSTYDGNKLPWDGPWTETWDMCLDAAYELLEYPSDDHVTAAQQRVGLCFAQQMLANDPRRTPETVRRVSTQLLKEAYQ